MKKSAGAYKIKVGDLVRFREDKWFLKELRDKIGIVVKIECDCYYSIFCLRKVCNCYVDYDDLFFLKN